MTDELEPDRMRSLHERMERQLGADVDVDATWALVRARITASKVVPLSLRRRSRRVIALAIAAALIVSGSALAGMRQRTGEAGHPDPGGAHAPSLAPTTDHEQESGPADGTTSGPIGTGTPVGETDDHGEDGTTTDGHDGDQSESSSQGEDGGSGGQDGDQSGSGDQVDQSGSSTDQSVQDSHQVDGGGQASDNPSSDGGADLSGGDGSGPG